MRGEREIIPDSTIREYEEESSKLRAMIEDLRYKAEWIDRRDGSYENLGEDDTDILFEMEEIVIGGDDNLYEQIIKVRSLAWDIREINNENEARELRETDEEAAEAYFHG